MNFTYSKLLIIGTLNILINAVLGTKAMGQPKPAENKYEGYYLHIKAYPSGAVSWGEDQREVQGITHDDSYWYITSTDRSSFIDKTIDNAFLWKIPVGEDLNRNVDTNPAVVSRNLYDLPMLWYHGYPKLGYVHWGDLDHYRYNGIDYLVVPMTSSVRSNGFLAWGDPAVWIFRAIDLSPVGYGLLPGASDTGQVDVGWCAVNPLTGYLYTSNDRTNGVFRYEIPWHLLPNAGYLGEFQVAYKDWYWLEDASSNILDLHNMQGGEFTPSGELLYISNGRGRCKGQGATDPGLPTDGIHSFETTNWRELKRSTNGCVPDCESGQRSHFDFTYDPHCGVLETHSDQPEGLTIWDLDDGRAPNVSGQLHVLVASVGLVGNNASLEHFGGRLYVDGVKGKVAGWTNPLPGTTERPFLTVGDAFEWYPVWDGAEIVIRGESYPETGTFSTRVCLVSQGGVATLGGSGTSVQGVQLFQGPNYLGDFKFFSSDVSDLGFLSINFDNATSSVRIYNLKEVRLFAAKNFGYPYLSVTQDIPDLSRLGWDRKVSSVRLIR